MLLLFDAYQVSRRSVLQASVIHPSMAGTACRQMRSLSSTAGPSTTIAGDSPNAPSAATPNYAPASFTSTRGREPPLGAQTAPATGRPCAHAEARRVGAIR